MMNFKATGILLLLLIILGGYAYNFVLNKPAPPAPKPPQVYQFDMDNIVKLDLQYQGKSVVVIQDPQTEEWSFPDLSLGEVDLPRITGMRLLLSGPGANRQLFSDRPSPVQLQEYGLAPPNIDVAITLKSGATHTVLIGVMTPNERNYYTKNADSDTIYLVDYTWGDEIIRFVAEPPLKPAVEQASQ